MAKRKNGKRQFNIWLPVEVINAVKLAAVFHDETISDAAERMFRAALDKAEDSSDAA